MSEKSDSLKRLFDLVNQTLYFSEKVNGEGNLFKVFSTGDNPFKTDTDEMKELYGDYWMN